MSQNPENKKKKPQEDKVELAQRIAEQSERITKRYQAIGDAAVRVVRWFSAWFDRILFNSRHSKLVAFGLAMLIYLAFNTSTSVISTVQYSNEFSNVPVVANYNSELYEVIGIDEAVDVHISGDYADVTMAESQSEYQVILDMSGLTEGTHQVKYTVQGFSSRLKTMVEPESATVTIRLKETKTLQLGYDFINLDQLGSQYVLGDPVFDSTEVTVKASNETLQQVAFVKALIDVSGQTSAFETDATIVAYDQTGNRIENVDIIPGTVAVSVDVSSPSKNVALVPVFNGTIPDGKAVQEVTLSNDTITIYAPQTVLDNITSISIPIQATTLTDDTRRIHNLSLPSGVRSASISTVNLDIKLGEGVTQVFENVPISFANNINGYKFRFNPEDVVTSVEVFGTQENIDAMDINTVTAYIDVRGLEPGTNIESDVYINSNYPLLSITPLKKTIIYDLVE